jgi:ketosteroid isomerase-like protein
MRSQTNSSDGVAAVTKLENDQVKAALANDVSFIKTNLADDLVEGTSFGEWLTKASLVADAGDPAKNKTNSMTISDLKVSAHGNVAIARYLNTYDDVYHGQHRSRSVICTDTWANEDGAWKLVANHCSQKKGRVV